MLYKYYNDIALEEKEIPRKQCKVIYVMIMLIEPKIIISYKVLFPSFKC